MRAMYQATAMQATVAVAVTVGPVLGTTTQQDIEAATGMTDVLRPATLAELIGPRAAREAEEAERRVAEWIAERRRQRKRRQDDHGTDNYR